jgi:hypothetical protein
VDSFASFDSTKKDLQEILAAIAKGDIQLPDFQRSWIWDDDHVRSLLASVSLSFPIGALMLLQTGNAEVRFKPRCVEGVELRSEVEPTQLILDGQHRLTALFLSLRSNKPVPTKDARDKPLKRWYYISIPKALQPEADREEAIYSLPEDRIIRDFRYQPINDYSTPEREFEEGMFPLTQVFDCSEWRRGYNKYWNYDPEKMSAFDDFEKEVVKRFEKYLVPVIELGKATPKEAVCQVFEKVNTAGVALTVFELLTATYAADNFNLRDDWDERKRRLHQRPVLGNLQSTDFIQSVSLLATQAQRVSDIAQGASPDNARGVSCKRKDVLRLSLEDYLRWADVVEKGYLDAARLLHSQYIFASRDIPYRTQFVPLAAILASLGPQAETAGVRERLVRWFWCGVLGELYGSAVESRAAKDLEQVLAWIKGGGEPDTIRDANFAPSRLMTLRTRNSAAYKGLYAIMMRDGARDLRTGEGIIDATYFDEKTDIHHIFPQDWCARSGVEPGRCDSIINKTALSARTNRMIGGKAPSEYLVRMQNAGGLDEEGMDAALETHLIEPQTVREDDFEAFFEARRQALLERIQTVMGKTLLLGESEEEEPMPTAFQEEDAA